MAQIIRGKNRKGRSAQIIVYDLQGTVLPQEFLVKMEDQIIRFLETDPAGSSVAVVVNVE